MTLEQRIAAQIQAWRNAGHPEQVDYLRKQMAALLSPFYQGRK